MHITVEPRDNAAILHLRGEFDTYYCHLLQEEIDEVKKSGVNRIVLNLRLVKFINSTALGAIIKASRSLTKDDGRLVISRPSAFCRDILEKVGLDRVVLVHGTDEDALRTLGGVEAEAAASSGDDKIFEEDKSSVLFTLLDTERLQHFIKTEKANPVHGHTFGKAWSGVGRMSRLDENGLAFTWNGGNTDLSAFDMGQMLAIGTKLKVKFRLPLLQRGYCEAIVETDILEERPEGVKVGGLFREIDEETRDSVRQYSQDMEFLKDELRKATE